MKYLALLALFVAIYPRLSVAADYDKVAEHTLFNGDKVSEFKLSNGLRVLLMPRHQAKVLTFQTWFNVGSIHEKLAPKLKKTGLAHLFEHMMFRGSEKYPDGVFDQLTSRMGANKQNATTFFYRTNYFQNVPSSQLEKLMEMESDRMKSLKVTPAIFEKEKGAVVGELRRHLDSPARIAYDELINLMFDVAPYRYTVIGTEAEIKGFTIEEAQYFYKTFYAPNNATLVVVGDATEQTLMPLVLKYYKTMVNQEIPKFELPTEPEQKKEKRRNVTHKQATSEVLLLGYRIPPVTSDDTVPISLVVSHLSFGMEGRLRKALVDTNVAVAAQAGVNNQPDMLEILVQLTEKKKAEDAIKIIDKEIDLLQKQLISKPQFQRAMNQRLLELYGQLTDNSSMGNILGESLMVSGNYLREFEILEQYKKAQPKDLQRVAKQYLSPKNRSIVIIRPEKKGKS